MTIKQACDTAMLIRPSQFTATTLVPWLAQLDGQIDVEIIQTHEDAPETDYVPYDTTAEGYDEDASLLVAAPYDKMYVDFLVSMIDFHLSDYGRYNNTGKRFEADYREFSDYYNRVHLPLQNNSISVGTDVDESVLPVELT